MIYCIVMLMLAAQTHLAGRVFETPGLASMTLQVQKAYFIKQKNLSDVCLNK